MKGFHNDTIPVFEFLKQLDILDEYLLVGGTALSLQIRHRLSEDLDFCKWQDDPSLMKKEVAWSRIEREFNVFGAVSTEVLDLNQVIFYLDGVKVEFYSNRIANSRGIASDRKIGSIRLADLASIGTMKLELRCRRNTFRDYYDIYSILREGVSLKDLVERCGRYSRHRMKSKSLLAILADHNRFHYEEDFALMEPNYQVNSEEIGAFIKEIIRKEFDR